MSKESLDFCANVEKHLQQSGAVNRFLANIVFVGLPGSGKSTLIARLLNLKGIDELLRANESTGVIDGIVTVDVTGDEASMHAASIGKNCEWHKVEFGLSCLRQMGMKSFVLIKAPEDHRHPSPTEANLAENVPSSSLTEHDSQKPVRSSDKKQKRELKKDAPKHAEVSSPKHVMATVQGLLQTKGFSAVLPYLDNKSSLYLSDTGE